MKTKSQLLLAGLVLGLIHSAWAQPIITNQPQNQTNVAGTTATFTVGATGVDPLSYQWRSYANPITFTNIPFGTEATLLLTNVQPATRRFAVMVTDSGGLSATSSPLVSLTVVSPPVITNQPASQAGVRGYPITFSVGAGGTAPLAYQWYFNDTNLPGRTTDLLTLPPVSDANAGNYFVTVTNRYGAVTSQVARLTVGADFFTKVTAGPGNDVGNTRGSAWGDYDNDGFIDLFVGQIGPDGISSASHFLYHNNTNGTFSRVTNGPVAAVVSAPGRPAWGDYDNDGYLDLVLVNDDQPNYLFHNNGAGSFTEVPSAVSSDILAVSRGVTWVDYDNDGYVDLFRATILDEPRRLYHNNHDGTFTRITQGDFLNARAGVFGVAWGDYNNDGRPDLFLPQSNEPSGLPAYLYRNDGGGTFTRVGAGTLDGTSNGYGAAWGDYDNDGDLDLFVSCGWPQGPGIGRPNLFYRNNGDGTFTRLTSLPANDPEYEGGTSTGCKWGDYDNDGWLDLFVANSLGQNDFLYHNNGDGTFTKVGSIAVNDGVDSRAPAWGDYDNDGFLDLFVGNLSGTNFLYHNNGNDNHWLKFRLIGTRSNRAAIGAKVRVHATINGRSFWQMREISGGDGITGQDDMRPNFGLGNATTIDTVRIEWPSGTVQELHDIASNQILTITEPGGEPRLAATRENGQVQLTLTGKQGSRYALETSTALPNWTSAGLTVTVTNQSGAVTFPAPGAISSAQRFYRAVWK